VALEQFAVMFHEGALKEIGDAVRPYLSPGEFGPYLLGTRIERAIPFTRLVTHVDVKDRGKLQVGVHVPSAFIRQALDISNHRPLGFTDG
jgi:hypothetical protein